MSTKKTGKTTRYWVYAHPSWTFILMAEVNKDDSEWCSKQWSINTDEKSHMFKANIKKGDKGILWGNDENPGCYGIFTICSDLYKSSDSDKHYEPTADGKDVKWKGQLGKADKAPDNADADKEETKWMCDAKTTTDLSKNPILMEELDREPWFVELKKQPLDDSLELTVDQYNAFLSLIEKKTGKKITE